MDSSGMRAAHSEDRKVPDDNARLQAIQETQKDLSEAMQGVAIQLARLDERQQETTRKVDAITIAMSNNYVGAIEFGIVKKELTDYKIYADAERQRIWTAIEALKDERESDRTWFIRLTIAGALGLLATFFGLKKGL